MRAAVLRQPGTRMEIHDVDLLPPRHGEVTVRVAAAGVCHSDLHYIKGDLKHPLPVILGHEGAGIVEAVGPGVTRVHPGDHVVFLFRAYCGQCFYCLRGQPAHCDFNVRIRTTGRMPDGTTRFLLDGEEVTQLAGVGCFAERTVVAEQSLVKVAPDIPLARAALVGCGVTTGVGAVLFTARPPAGSSILVLGAGGVGLSAVQGAVLAGASPIIAADVVTRKLEWARAFGATHTVDAGSQDVVADVRALTDGRGVDYAFECIGRLETMQQAYRAARRGGTLVIVGLARDDVMFPLRPFHLLIEEKTVRASLYGSANFPRDIPMLLDLDRAGRLRLEEMITERFRLDEINEAYARLEEGRLARSVILFD